MKRSIAVLLSAIMLLSLCACGGETSTKTEKRTLGTSDLMRTTIKGPDVG